MKDEFLYRWPGARHLMNLKELEARMDRIISEQVRHDFDVMDSIMVEVFDSKILRRDNGQQATLGKMSIASVVQKFH